MKTHIRILSLIALVASLAAQVHAQSYTVGVLLSGGTNSVSANATNTYAAPVTLTKYGDVALSIGFKAGAVGSSNVVFVFEQSLDGITYGTADRLRIAVPGNGASTVVLHTNLALNSVGYLRLASVENTFATTFVTNITVRYALKPKRNG